MGERWSDDMAILTDKNKLQSPRYTTGHYMYLSGKDNLIRCHECWKNVNKVIVLDNNCPPEDFLICEECLEKALQLIKKGE